MPYHLTPEQRWFVVKHHSEGLSWEQIGTQWQLSYPDRNPPAVRTMKTLVAKMDQHHTLQDLRKGRSGRKRSVRTPFNIQWVLTILNDDMLSIPGDRVNSARRNQIQMNKSSWNRITKTDLQMHPYRVVRRQRLKLRHKQERLTMGQFLTQQPQAYFDNLSCSDEAYFTLNGHVFNR